MLEKGNTPTSYKPGAWYFRDALRRARNKAEAEEIGMQAVREIEHLREFIRESGLYPPKKFVLRREVEEKGWPAV